MIDQNLVEFSRVADAFNILTVVDPGPAAGTPNGIFLKFRQLLQDYQHLNL